MSDYSLVAIPSNRVNVSYSPSDYEVPICVEGVSQSPQIGSMFPTLQVTSLQVTSLQVSKL